MGLNQTGQSALASSLFDYMRQAYGESGMNSATIQPSPLQTSLRDTSNPINSDTNIMNGQPSTPVDSTPKVNNADNSWILGQTGNPSEGPGGTPSGNGLKNQAAGAGISSMMSGMLESW